jgi:hypothetical protein
MSRTLRLSEDQLAARSKGKKVNPEPLEHDSQSAFFTFWREYAKLRAFPECLCFAIPNASDLTEKGRIYKWKEGLTAGVLDVFLSIPMRDAHGLYIEFKRRPNKPTIAQETFQEAALDSGYRAVVCYSAQEAIDVTIEYLEGSVR